jgi:hypothetical protein
VTRPEKRPRRWIAIALVAVVVLIAILALIVPNALLRSDFIRKRINKDPEHGWLEYDSAYSRWPGTLHVKNLSFRDQDPKAEWAFQLADADLTYSLADLLRRRFHVTRLSGRGFVFRVRSRLTRAEATPSRLSRLPPIPGFPDPPLVGRPEPPEPSTGGKEWSIHVESVAIDDARDVWIEGYRCTGDARVTGGFFLWPKHEAQVYPSKLAIRNGTIRSGKDAIAADVRATFEARIGPWDPQKFPGSKVLRFVGGDAKATARLDDAEVLNRLLGEPAGTRLEKGSGRMNVEASVEKGVAKGSIDYGSRDLALRILDVGMRGRFDGRVELSGVQLQTWGGGRLDGGHVNLTGATVWDRAGATYPWWGRVAFERGEFRPKTAFLFTTTADARAKNAQPLMQIVNVDLPEWAKRLLRLDDPVAARSAIRVGPSVVELRRLAARTGKLRIFGEYVERGSSKNGTFLIDTGLLSVGVGISGREKEVRIFGPRKWFRERTGWEPEKD